VFAKSHTVWRENAPLSKKSQTKKEYTKSAAVFFAKTRTVPRVNAQNGFAQTRRGHSPPRFASQMTRHPRCITVRVILSVVEVCEVRRGKRANRKAKPLRDLSKSVAIPCAQSNICAGTWRIHTAPRTKQNEKSPPNGGLFLLYKGYEKDIFCVLQ